MEIKPISPEENQLILSAKKLIASVYHKTRHTVSVSLLTGSGKIYTSVNVASHSYCSHAEPIALGMAIANGETKFMSLVAIEYDGSNYLIVAPCGSCRQLLSDYCPGLEVLLLDNNGKVEKIDMEKLLPLSYKSKRAKL